ncbi:MAG: hypothetical protein WBM17_03400 [Anaerolineales bacterium]
MKHLRYYLILIIILPTAVTLARGSSATLIPLTPCADYFPDTPMVHKKGTAIVYKKGEPLRLRRVNLGGW